MRVLVVGSGGREHALAWKLAQSPQVSEVLCAPGNAGTEGVARNVPVKVDDIEGLVGLAVREDVVLTVVGPEVPLALGLADALRAAGRDVFGPDKEAARIESSKVFAKELMERAGVPTAGAAVFTDEAALRIHLASGDGPCVLKADGLAAGKGVVVCADRAEALASLGDFFGGRLAASSRQVMVEEFLKGFEISYQVIASGRAYIPLAPSQDHKRRDDGDEGPNTGGMGAICPAPGLDAATERAVQQTVIEPVLAALEDAGADFRGCLYAGLMMTASGPKVLEFNARFGDPETQPLMHRLESDLFPVLLAAARGTLGKDADALSWSPKAACAVVLASEGYPAAARKGRPIGGLESLPSDAVVFHAGVRREGDELVSSGGRVLAVSALGDDLDAARHRATSALGQVVLEGSFYRSDIGAAAARRMS